MEFRSPGSWWTEAQRIAQRQARRAGSDAADELAQDLAVAALQKIYAAQNPGAWLERVAKNAVIDRWRRDDRRKNLLATVGEPAPRRDPEADFLGHEQRQAVRRAVAQLPRVQRHVALLRFAGGLSLDTIAARLGTPPATARSRLHRALRSLRQQLSHLRATVILGWSGMQTAALSLALFVATTKAPPPLPTIAPSPARSPSRPIVAQALAHEPAAPSAIAVPVNPPAARVARTLAQCAGSAVTAAARRSADAVR